MEYSRLEFPSLRPFRGNDIPVPSGGSRFCLPAEFPATTPVDLEMGCGVGFHPIRYASENPNRYLIAVERTAEKFGKFRRRLEHHRPLANLLPVHADAVNWVTHFLPPATVSRCFIYYPNPEPQNPARRWIRMPFFARLLESLRDNGELVIASNRTEYLDEVREWAPHRGLRVVADRVLNPGSVVRTHFEKKYLERGETCVELTLQKALLPAPFGVVTSSSAGKTEGGRTQ